MGFAQFPIEGGLVSYPTLGLFPIPAPSGVIAAVAQDTDILYIWDAQTSSWVAVGGTSVPLVVGSMDSASKKVTGATIGSNSLFMQTADAVFPGLVSSASQSFGGVKTFGTHVNVGGTLTVGSGTSTSVIKTVDFVSGTTRTLQIQTGNTSSGDSATGNVEIYSGVPEGAGDSGYVFIGTGDGDISGDTGEIRLQPGTTSSGVGVSGHIVLSAGLRSGLIQFQNADEGSAEHYWKSIDAQGSGKWVAGPTGSNTGDIWLTVVGTNPNPQGATVSSTSQVLTLQPADVLNPGVVSTASQVFSGTKSFSRVEVGGSVVASTSVQSTVFSTYTASPATTGVLRFANDEGYFWRNAENTGNIGIYLNTSNAIVPNGAPQFGFGLGNAGSPAMFLSTDSTSGFYRSGASQWGWASAGVQILNFHSGGLSVTGAVSATTFVSAVTNVSAGGDVTVGGNVSCSNTIRSAQVVAPTVTIGSVSFTQSAGGAAFPLAYPAGTPTAAQQALTASSGSSQLSWTTVLANPMTTSGDIVIGSGSGVAARLAGNTSNSASFLMSVGSGGLAMPPAWQLNSGPTVVTIGTASGTYTCPSGIRWLRVRLIGGGGGSSGSGTNGSTTTSGSGSITTFGSVLSGFGGGGAARLASGGGGGGGSVTAPANGFVVPGGWGGTSNNATIDSTLNAVGGHGGSGFFGGAGRAGKSASAGTAGVDNTGGGAGGPGANSTASNVGGNGGGAGGYVEAVIRNPDPTYAYSVGDGGPGGTAGNNGVNGSKGGTGVIIVEEHYV